MRTTKLKSLTPIFLTCLPLTAQGESQGALRAQLQRAGDNRAAIAKALDGAPKEHRAAMRFLVRHMPEQDLRALTAERLLTEVRLAHEALAAAPWRTRISAAMFHNYILPYANVSESRDPWRAEFRKRFLPLIAHCTSPGEAAHVLNSKIFKMMGVRYSTQRRRADQSPKESEAIGMASCTGLSIILVNACRAVGIPARLAGIANWVNKRGNHTWVEVWDGEWHFTGAAEANGNGLNHTWFQGDAALAKPDVPRNAIYAVSYEKTKQPFPMVWSRRGPRAFGVNVTERYLRKDLGPDAATTRLMVRVRQYPGGPRVAADVQARLPRVKQPLQGQSRDEENDTNDFLTFPIPRGTSLRVTAKFAGLTGAAYATCEGAQTLVEIAIMSKAEAAVHRAALDYSWQPSGRVAAFAASVRKEFARNPTRCHPLVMDAYRRHHKQKGTAAPPRRVAWDATPKDSSRHWVSCRGNASGRVDVQCKGNVIDVTTEVDLTLALPPFFLNFDQPITVRRDGKSTKHALTPDIDTLCRTLIAGQPAWAQLQIRSTD